METYLLLRESDHSVYAECHSKAELRRAVEALMREEDDQGIVVELQGE